VILHVPVDSVDGFWPLVAPAFEQGFARTGGDTGVAEFYPMCRRGEAHILIAYEDGQLLGATLWRAERWATGWKMRCVCFAGKQIRRWKDEMYEAGKALARSNGANGIIGEGPDGWRYFFPKAKPVRVVFEEKLDG